ncbi:MAG: hypothetical protein EAZ85_15605 [Bacteroidetes bacterium]|nr:MAG: hypothetical protein EAZ85_15605 [Bacteroidota bacterium]TAG92736.1 MAG: hypothetical protein EAZ20_02285 [Bacteroidota bacterium]
MIESAHFRQLFSYEHWANARLIAFMQGLPPQYILPKILDIFSHILNAQTIWLLRARKENSDFEAWASFGLTECWARYMQGITEWETFLSSLEEDEFYENIVYQNSKGETYQNNLIEIMTHLVNHSTYHRGQIIAYFQQQNIKGLPPTDFIVFLREMN